MEFTDSELASQISKGNQRAFSYLLDRYGGLIKSIVVYHLRDLKMWQEDCISDIIFSVWHNIKSYDSSKNTLKKWIGAVAKYRCIDYKRKYIREANFCEADEKYFADIPDTDTFRSELREEIDTLLSGLSDEDKELFVRRYMLGETIEEISKEKNKSNSWVYTRISRSRKKLKNIYSRKRS